MRRAEREVFGKAIEEIMDRCEVCRIALADGEVPYVVPLNFGYERTEKGFSLYFHCATEGKKLDLIRQNGRAFFEMDCSHRLITADSPCGYTFTFESVMGKGTVRVLESEEDKVRALTHIMKKYGWIGDPEFLTEKLGRVSVIRLDTEEYSAKSHLK